MDPVLLIPRRLRGARYCNLSVEGGEYFNLARRFQGTNNLCWCGWVNLRSFPTGNRPLWYAHSPTYNIGWSIYFRQTTRMLQISWGNGSAIADMLATTNAIPIGSWTFIAININRAGNITAYLNGSGTKVIEGDISAYSAVSWDVTPTTWYMGGVWNSSHDVFISRVGFSIGNLLTLEEIDTLYNGGYGLMYSQLTGDLITKFANQDYWNCNELSGVLVNSSTPAHHATGENKNLGTTTAIKSVGPPRP